jgi:hypothetical protein
MKSLFLASVLLAPACFGGERAQTGQCPAGETCSTLTPNGLHFIGKNLADTVLLTGPAPTAIGGTQEVALQYDRGDGILIALDLPFSADDDGGIGVKVDHTSGSVVTVRGAGSRTNYLRIIDPTTSELFDRKELTGADLSTIELAPIVYESIPVDATVVWVAGDVKLGVALYGAVQTGSGPYDNRIVDTSMQVSAGSMTRPSWDTLQLLGATVGTYPITVTAGNKPAANLDLTVVSHPDALAAIESSSTTLMPGSHQVCFQATNSGRYVAGLDNWSFALDGVTITDTLAPKNCASFETTATSGTMTLHASVAGLVADKTLYLANQGVRLIPATRSGFTPVPTVGDRAAM